MKLSFPVAAERDVIEDLKERDILRWIAEMKQLVEHIARHHDNLLKTMTNEQKKIFKKLDDCWSEYASYAEKAIFIYAFKLGMQIAIETLTK